MRKKWLVALAFAPVAIAVVVGIGGGLVMLLWNWLLPPLFGWPPVTFWQGFGLLALCRILFGGCGMRGSYRPNRTPEERERIRLAIRRRFGFGSSTDESKGTPASQD